LKDKDSWTLKKIDYGIESVDEIYYKILSFKNLANEVKDKIIPVIESNIITNNNDALSIIREMFNYQSSKRQHSSRYYLENKIVLFSEFLMGSKRVRQTLFTELFDCKYTQDGSIISSKDKLEEVFLSNIIKTKNDSNKIVVKIKS
jgi:hypothetical protein